MIYHNERKLSSHVSNIEIVSYSWSFLLVLFNCVHGYLDWIHVHFGFGWMESIDFGFGWMESIDRRLLIKIIGSPEFHISGEIERAKRVPISRKIVLIVLTYQHNISGTYCWTVSLLAVQSYQVEYSPPITPHSGWWGGYMAGEESTLHKWTKTAKQQ